MERWKGKVAVVTGASAGIGAAIALKLLQHGVEVVGFARRKEKVEALSKDNAKLHALQVDITEEEQILQGFQWVEKNIGPVSILVNNAGITSKNSIINGDSEKWRQVLNTNVLGLTIATREAIRSMQANNIDGHIININSICGHQVMPLPYHNVYPASKFAVTALTETLRLDLTAIGSKIKITSVSPGHVRTEIFEAGGLLEDENIVKMAALAPALSSDDVADAVLYALSSPPHVQISEITIKPVGEMV